MSARQREKLTVELPWMYTRSNTKSCGIAASVFWMSPEVPIATSALVLPTPAATVISTPTNRKWCAPGATVIAELPFGVTILGSADA